MENMIIKTKTILDEAYATLKEANLTKTKADFSNDWLHKSQRYYSMLISTNSMVSVEALATLAARLQTTALHMKEHGLKTNLHDTANIADMAVKVAEALNDRALTRRLRKQA
jgi:hypothetical protein